MAQAPVAAKVGVEHSCEFIKDLQELAVGLVRVVKKKQYLALLGLIGEVKDLVEGAPKVLPELSDLEPAEVGVLSAASYSLVRSVIAAVVAA